MLFLNHLMLWGLLAASIPIIIHLLNRRRHKTIQWAAMQFLLKATRESRGKKKLRHFLILACRTLGIAALVLAAARPIVSGLLGWGGGSPTILKPADIGDLTRHIRKTFDVAPDAEFAVEIDPRWQIAPVQPLAQPAVASRGKIPPPVKPIPPVTARPAPQVAPSTSRPGRPDSIALPGQIAGLEADAERQASAGVRSKWVSLVDTRSPAGFYAADWARKVTRIGEMNFPDAARRLNSSTGPLLEVAIRADGSLREVRVARSSGNAELDRAARRIVELAAPYPPFPAELRQQVDLLKIESPWRFDPGGRIQAR